MSMAIRALPVDPEAANVKRARDRPRIGLKASEEFANLRAPLRRPTRVTFMSDDATTGPFLVLTAICDASARPAAVTLGHGDAMERALNAANGHETIGIDLVELPIA